MDLTKLAKVEDRDAALASGTPGSPGSPGATSASRRWSHDSSGRRKQSTMGTVSVGMALLSILLAVIGVPAKHAAGYGTTMILIVLMSAIAALCVVGIAAAIMGVTSKRRSPLMPLIGLVLNPIVALAFAIFLWWPTASTLMAAAENGDAEGVDRAVAMGVNVNDHAVMRDGDDERFLATPLIGAANNGQLNTVTALLAHGADVDAADDRGRTPLYHAVKNGHGDVAAALLRHQADPNLSPPGKTPLYFAVASGNAPLVDQMLRQGAAANIKDHPPLLLAAAAGHTKIAELLLERQADIHAVSDTGDTPLHIAAGKGHQFLVKLLLRKQADVTIKNKFDETPLHRAVEGNHKPVIDDLLNVDAPVDIYAAIGLGDLDRVRKELEADEELVHATRRNLTPLHAAAQRGRLEIVALLLEHGADPNAKADNNAGATPLYLAAIGGHLDTVQLLIENEAVVNDVVTIDGITAPPLYFAVVGGHAEMVDALLAAGADVNVRCQRPPDPDSTIPVVGSPLTFAVLHRHRDVARRLLNAKADPDFRPKPDAPTPLFEAVRHADVDMVELLLSFKANVNAKSGGITVITDIEQRQRGHQEAEALDRIHAMLRDAGAMN